jgi:hypothetical protein
MFIKVPFSRFGIPVDRLGFKVRGNLSVEHIKIFGIVEEPFTCLKCGAKKENGFLAYFRGNDIVSCGVAFPFNFSAYLCFECVPGVIQALTYR